LVSLRIQSLGLIFYLFYTTDLFSLFTKLVSSMMTTSKHLYMVFLVGRSLLWDR